MKQVEGRSGTTLQYPSNSINKMHDPYSQQRKSSADNILSPTPSVMSPLFSDSQESELAAGTDFDDFSDASTSSRQFTVKKPSTNIITAEPYTRRDTENRKVHAEVIALPKVISAGKEKADRSGSPTPSNSSHRKSVSFDLGDPEFRTIYIDDPQIVTIKKSISHERLLNDNYEIPVETVKHQKKGILRSPSPMSNNSTLDRPPIVPPAPLPVNTARREKILPDGEIERENPFRKEFFAEEEEDHSPDQNIYEEIDFTRAKFKDSSDSEGYESGRISGPGRESRFLNRERPKSTYDSDNSVMSPIEEHTSNRYYSNEHLLEEPEKRIPIKWPVHKSTGDLLDRSNIRPPLPPKPPAKLPDALSYANVSYKDVQSTSQSIELVEVIERETPIVSETTPRPESKKFEFDAYAPLPPLPSLPPPSPRIKTFKRHPSTERPTESPPPPPVNMATLPSRNKVHRFDADPTIIGIVPTKFHILPTARHVEFVHENSPENILVTETTHREIMLHENDLRNSIRESQSIAAPSSKLNVPVRQAPPPPPPAHRQQSTPSTPMTPQHVQSPMFMPSQIFPQSQILPVQFSHLPMPQQTGYFQPFQPPLPPLPPTAQPITTTTTIHHHHGGGYSVGGTGHSSPMPNYMVSDANMLGSHYLHQHHQHQQQSAQTSKHHHQVMTDGQVGHPFMMPYFSKQILSPPPPLPPLSSGHPLYVNVSPENNWQNYYTQQQHHQQFQRQQHLLLQAQSVPQLDYPNSSINSTSSLSHSTNAQNFQSYKHNTNSYLSELSPIEIAGPPSPAPSSTSSNNSSYRSTAASTLIKSNRAKRATGSPPILGKQTSV